MTESMKQQVLKCVKQAADVTSDEKAPKEDQLLHDVQRMIESGKFVRRMTGERDYEETISYTVPKK